MNVSDLGGMALTLAVAGIIIAFSLLVLTDLGEEIETQTSADSAASNATDDVISGVAEFSGWFSLIAMALVFSIIIGVIVQHIGGAGRP